MTKLDYFLAKTNEGRNIFGDPFANLTEDVSATDALNTILANILVLPPLKFEPESKNSLIIQRVIEERIFTASEVCQFFLLGKENTLYIYTGNHWVEVSDDLLTEFLRDAFDAAGVDRVRVASARFMEEAKKSLIMLTTQSFERGGDVYINLKTETLRVSPEGNITVTMHTPEDFITYVLPYSYDEKATCPLFQKFLDEVLPDKSLQNILAEFIAYCFIPSNVLKLEKVLMLYGNGSNGKSVFTSVMSALLGKENVSGYNLSLLTDPKGGNYRAGIENKLINFSYESGKIMENDLFKQLVSGEPVEAKKLYKDVYVMENYAKLCFSTNREPNAGDYSNGFFRRFLIILIIPDKLSHCSGGN